MVTVVNHAARDKTTELYEKIKKVQLMMIKHPAFRRAPNVRLLGIMTIFSYGAPM